ncbi:MAG: hypothetical protein V3W18_14710 [candidate division Zixibacteria bacterium]
MSKKQKAQTLEEAAKLELTDGSKEIVRLASEGRLGTWHGATGWMVSASVVGGPCEVHISFAGKKMKWSGIIAGVSVGGEMSAMTGIMRMEPAELMKCKYLTLSSIKVLLGTTRVEFWKSEGLGFAGNLVGVGFGLGANLLTFGWGEWTYE